MQAKPQIQWSHAHDFGIDSKQQAKKVWTVFWITTLVMIVEITAGTWSGSMALLADGWHMGTHSAAFAITIFAYSYAKKHANNKAFSFGTGKVNSLGGFASAVALAIVALMMAIESVQRLVEPHQILFNEAIMVAILGLIVNLVSVLVLHDDHHHAHDHHHHDHREHKHGHDHNMKAAYFHVLADTLTSLLAIFALLAGKFFGLIWMDALMGIVGALVIGRWSYGLIKESSDILLDKSLQQSKIEQITQTIINDENTTITDLHIWKIANDHYGAIMSISVATPLSTHCYVDKIKACLPQLAHCTVEINRNDES